MMDKLLQYDIKKVKELLRDDKQKKLIRFCKGFTSSYNMKILKGLNPFEVNEWLRINNY